MPEAAEILVFNLTGRTRVPEQRSLKEQLGAFVRPPLRRRFRTVKPESEEREIEQPAAVAVLNENSEAIANTLETEILTALPPDLSLSVQVELRFRSGSLVMIGTAAILSWTGSIVLV